VLVDEKKKTIVNYDFCMKAPDAKENTPTTPGKYLDYVAMNIELGELRQKCVDLERQIVEKDLLINELEDELEDEGIGAAEPEPTTVEKIMKVIPEDRILSLVDGIIGMLSPNKQPPAVSGIPNDDLAKQAVDIVTELHKHDPKIIAHLGKILNIANTNKFMFNQLIKGIDDL